ncbi:uncharacterized protein LOC110457506 [Mizuhopecten yessoensis]|uniref:Ankyrin repeat domain-containing protein 60 n=1 Tax=Mizuhopecten yessoensis TaxID=6573 RepID=A0A210Q8N7_MIZYE|nr:uncharacterized protein LOC110457506 [Mizuhopecten yessoensis]OWF45098.1 Ankyrin repeat domain-containing protein 60 [Mizuhopecten yessoensis]
MPTLTDTTFTLFVILPSQNVCTLRRLSSGITVTNLKCNLELMAGFPAHVYRLAYPDGEMLEDNKRLLIKKTVDDGYVLRMVLDAEWDSLCQNILQDNVELVYSDVSQGGVVPADHVDRASCALFMASHRGQIRMCNMLISVGATVNWKTRFGRTAVHAAVSADCVCILELLAAEGAKADVEDVQGVTPSQTAITYGSTLCSKKLRLMQLNLRGKSAHARASERIVSRPPRIPSEPVRRPPNLPSETWRRPTTVHVSFPGVSDTSRVKSFDKLVNITSANSHLGECKHSSSSGFFAPNHHEMYLERARTFSRGQEKRHLNHSEDGGNVLFGKQLTILRSKRVLKFGSDDDIGNSRSHTPGSLRSEGCFTPALLNRNKSALSINSDQYGKDHGTDTTKMTIRPGKKSPKYVRFSANERFWTIFPRTNTNVNPESIKRKIHLVAGTRKTQVPQQTDYKYGDSHGAWLKKKKEVERKLEPDSSGDESDGNDDKNDEAFKNWIENKKHPPESKRHVTGNRPIHGIITIGSTEVGNAAQPDSTFNIRAYKEWLGRRKQHGPKSHRMRTMQDFMAQKRTLEEKRQQLLLTAVSYDEWLEHTGEKQALIRQILGADINQLRVIEERELQKRPKLYSANGQIKMATTESGTRTVGGQDKDALRKELLRYNASVHKHEAPLKINN